MSQFYPVNACQFHQTAHANAYSTLNTALSKKGLTKTWRDSENGQSAYPVCVWQTGHADRTLKMARLPVPSAKKLGKSCWWGMLLSCLSDPAEDFVQADHCALHSSPCVILYTKQQIKNCCHKNFFSSVSFNALHYVCPTYYSWWLGGLLVECRTSVSQIRGSIPGQVAAV